MHDIYKTFDGQAVFFTGVTGFVGKVFLWKLLKEFPTMKKIFVLIRTKKGQNPQDRLRTQVLSSPCFDAMKKELGEAEWDRRASKVIAVAGDIMEDKLGMSDDVYDTVAKEVSFIVHMAATVNFDERLDVSVKMNILGSLRVLALGHKARNLKAYVHMSTCYVNYARHGPHQSVRETLYPLPFDAEDMCKFILAQDVAMMPTVSSRLLRDYGFPNTYTFTKSMGEHLLERRKGAVPLTIIRPAIVGCALREPMPGWVDALTAAGGIYLTGGLGILRELHCHPENRADIIPVDYVVNTTVKLLHRTATFYASQPKQSPASPPTFDPSPLAVSGEGQGAKGRSGVFGIAALAASKLTGGNSSPAAETGVTMASPSDASSSGPGLPLVYQSASSSSLNAMRWETACSAVMEYWKQHPHPKAIHPVDITIIGSQTDYLFRLYTRRILPTMGLKMMASLPVVGSPQKKKLVARLEKAIHRSVDMQRQFAPFMNHEWCFDNTNTNGLDEWLKPEHVKTFSCDLYEINWHAYTKAYSFGMVRFIMKTDDGRSPPLMPASGSEIFLRATL